MSGATSASSACPICSRHFRQENLAMHVDSCLQASASAERKRKRDASSFPMFQSARSSKPRSPPPVSAAASATSEPISASPSQTPHSKRGGHLPQDHTPLAERMRPAQLDEFVGQDELVGPGKLLSTLIQSDRVPSMILWGPPGCGKTTLASVISRRTGCKFISLSGATSNMADMKEAIEKARGERKLLRRHTIVFVDEIHRFKKNQQDFFLPPVEDGTITLIGATTENPSFEINNALLSRCRVYTLQRHSVESIRCILERALLAQQGVQADDAALAYVANQCGGDARVALSCLELAMKTMPLTSTSSSSDVDANGNASAASPSSTTTATLTEEHVRHCFAHRATLLYDRHADYHYDLISAFHKSVRGSDDNAALYWLARMLEGGENPLYIARRMIRIAAEDVGLAAPHLMEQAVAAYQSAHFIGMPECDVVLAQCATLLARAPKSVEVYATYKRVKATVQGWTRGAQPDVPMHLRNAPTRLMNELGYGAGYLYNPDHTEEETRHQTYLPEELVGTDFFNDPGQKHQQDTRQEEHKQDT